MSNSYFNDLIHDLSKHCSRPALPAAQDTDAMMDRVIVLELLYHLDERHNRSHPHHNTYTGLWQQFQENGNHL